MKEVQRSRARERRYYTTGFEDGGRAHEPKDAALETGKDRKHKVL